MTLYLLDANVLIRAHEDYYPIDRIPHFWTWLLEQAEAGVIKIPREIYDEVARSHDSLGNWLRQEATKKHLLLAEPTNLANVRHILQNGYSPNLNDVEVEKIGRDPFLIASAFGHSDRVVVTREVSKPSAQRANRKVPDICAAFNIPIVTDFGLYRALNFRIA